MTRAIVIVATWLANAVTVQVACAEVVVPINPQATYLSTFNRGDVRALNATPVVLADLGVAPGDLVRLEALGDFNYNINENSNLELTDMIGVFSASDILLDRAVWHRVYDAIEAGEDFEAPIIGDADIPEDFRVTETVVTVPADATHLFVAAADLWLGDNRDLDGDFALRVTVVPEPCAATIIWCVAGIGLFGRRRTRPSCD